MLNHYQQAAVDRVVNQGGNILVNSVAGSGKTHTAMNIIAQINPVYQVLMGAFNTVIRDEFQLRGQEKGLRHASYMTFNGFGWKICLQNLMMANIDKFKMHKIFRGLLDPRTQKHVPILVRVASLCKNMLLISPSSGEIENLIARYDLDIPPNDSGQLVRTVQDALNISLADQRTLDFDDQKLFPLANGWTIPKYPYVLVDEFQDVCPVELALLLKASAGNFCGFGDPFQAIYGFKGATPDAFKRVPNSIEMPLSICYRCPTSVLDEARKIVPYIEAAPDAPVGVVDRRSLSKFRQFVDRGDFVLCRTTKELVQECLIAIGNRKPAKVYGRELGENLEYFIVKVLGDTPDDPTMPIDEFMQCMYELPVPVDDGRAQIFLDKIQTIEVLADNCRTLGDLQKQIKTIFIEVPNPAHVINFMTIHKAKGLQAKRVWILRPDLLPHPNCKQPWQLEEEQRLKYVAITRSQYELLWVK